MSTATAEIIESSTRAFVAEVHDGQDAPDFGSWVEVEQAETGDTLYGLVSHVEVSSYDSGRRPRAFGQSREELQRERPQVMELLRTTFRAQVLAYRPGGEQGGDRGGGSVRQTLPPRPPSIHDFVYCCVPEAVRTLGAPYDFLRTLVQPGPDTDVPTDDLLVAVLRQVRDAYGDARAGENQLVEAGRVLSRLLDDDHERLQSILRRAER
jgi:hypothetical protein